MLFHHVRSVLFLICLKFSRYLVYYVHFMFLHGFRSTCHWTIKLHLKSARNPTRIQQNDLIYPILLCNQTKLLVESRKRISLKRSCFQKKKKKVKTWNTFPKRKVKEINSINSNSYYKIIHCHNSSIILIFLYIYYNN